MGILDKKQASGGLSLFQNKKQPNVNIGLFCDGVCQSAFFAGNGGNGQIAVAAQGNALYAFGVDDVGKVQNIACNHFFAVQFQEGWDVFRIDQNINGGRKQGYAAALQFNSV